MKDIKRSRLLKVLHILNTTDENNPMNCSQIAEKLYEDYQIIAERQVILADINALKADGYEIESCLYKRNGYYMSSHLLEDWQLKILIDAINKAAFITPKVAKDIIDTLLKTTSRGNADFLRMATPLIEESTETPSKSKEISDMIRKGTQYNIATLLQSVFSSNQVSFNYRSISKDLSFQYRHDGKVYVVNPYLLYWDKDYYYLCGSESDAPAKLKTYRLDKIDNLKISKNPCISAEKALGSAYSEVLHRHVDSSIHHYGGQDKIMLTVKVPAFMVDYLFDEFSDQLISVKADGTDAIAKIHTTNTLGLKYLLLQYSENLEILEPIDFRNEFVNSIEDILRKYKR